MSDVRVLSLFSGAGGLDLGFHKEGFHIKGCIELDRAACDTLEANKGRYLDEKTRIICADITQLNPKELHKEFGTIDFMIGGPPCQSFSAAGRRAGGVYGVNDTRGSLFWYYAAFLKEFQPAGFLFENVKGILHANGKRDWTIIKAAFEELGYVLTHSVMDAADFETPQHRERVILVGTKRDIGFRFPRPVVGPNSIGRAPFVTPKVVFADIDDPNEVVPTYTGKYGHLLADIPPGLNYSFYTERMNHPNPLFAWRSKFSGFLYKLDPDEPTKTLVAHQGKYDGPFHWRNRKLTVPELVRIQGFPTDYIFCGGRVSNQRQIGNSVAPKLGRFLAKAVASQIFDRANPIDLLEQGEVLKRKRRSRTPRRTGPQAQRSPKQQSLLPDIIDWPNNQLSMDLYTDKYDNNCELSDGFWQLNVTPKVPEASDVTMKFDLSFVAPVAKCFNRIRCTLTTDSILNFNHAWDFVHKIIDESASYQSLQPLYGHFTEPYPKFTLQFSCSSPNHPIANLISRMSDFNFTSKTQRYSVLQEVFDEQIDLHDVVRTLRDRGVDIRIHETNRTIPPDHFRICYPFCLPSWQPTYTKWADVGTHRTGDLKIVDLIGESP